jgi:hypothetical protein
MRLNDKVVSELEKKCVENGIDPEELRRFLGSKAGEQCIREAKKKASEGELGDHMDSDLIEAIFEPDKPSEAIQYAKFNEDKIMKSFRESLRDTKRRLRFMYVVCDFKGHMHVGGDLPPEIFKDVVQHLSELTRESNFEEKMYGKQQ